MAEDKLGSPPLSQKPKQTKLEQSQIIKEEVVATGSWIALKRITYTDPKGKEREWEAISRTTRRKNNAADGVAVLPVLRRTLKYDCVVCVKQFRPPMRAYTLEFPAGLIDAGETPADAALRELYEETGYVGKVKHVSPATSLDPGTEDCSLITVTVEIDGNDDVNIDPKQKLDDTEFIEVVHIPLHDMLPRLNEMSTEGVVIDSRVYTYAIALAQATKTKAVIPDQK